MNANEAVITGLAVIATAVSVAAVGVALAAWRREAPPRPAEATSPAAIPTETAAARPQLTLAHAAEAERFLMALWWVEALGRADPPDGDGGRAIGPLQIHVDYWRDAIDRDQGARNAAPTWTSCRQWPVARRVALAYFDRYAREAFHARDWATCARIHNGGPKGATYVSTLVYAHRVLAAMQSRPWEARR